MWQPGNTLEDVERDAIVAAFRFFQSNKTRTAQALGIAIRTLDARLQRYEDQRNGKPVPPHQVSAGEETRPEPVDKDIAQGVRLEPAEKFPEKPAVPVRKQNKV